MFVAQPDRYVRVVFGARLRTMRKHRGLTQDQLAEQISVSRQWVCDVERGRTIPNAGRVRALCQLLNCSADLLLDL
jgi:transcriptional regulator with XRE-family HTH domain